MTPDVITSSGVRASRGPHQSDRVVLMVAFHFPPCAGSSGVQRTEKFVRYLPQFGWLPIVLTAHPRAYPNVHQASAIADSCPVVRAFALDAARHMSLRLRYPRLVAIPDRWASWWMPAVARGLGLIRRARPAVLWSTFPIATAHLVALTLHCLTGIPWVAEFRDPMIEGDYPPGHLLRATLRWLERRTVLHTRALIFTAPSACSLYRQRYQSVPGHHFRIIPNGYDDWDFDRLVAPPASATSPGRPLRIIHSGMIYRSERDPRPLFRALAQLKLRNQISAATLQVIFRGPSDDPELQKCLRELHVDDLVRICPPVDHAAALQEAALADALLLIQGPSCNRQIPAKVYEYLRLQRPILALTHPDGDSARLLASIGGATVVPLEEAAIAERLPRFLALVSTGIHPLPPPAAVVHFSRRRQTAAFAACLDEASLSFRAGSTHASTSA